MLIKRQMTYVICLFLVTSHCNGNEGSYCLGAGMVDAHKAIGLNFSPNIIVEDYFIDDFSGDSDGVVNPGNN